MNTMSISNGAAAGLASDKCCQLECKKCDAFIKLDKKTQ